MEQGAAPRSRREDPSSSSGLVVHNRPSVGDTRALEASALSGSFSEEHQGECAFSMVGRMDVAETSMPADAGEEEDLAIDEHRHLPPGEDYGPYP